MADITALGAAKAAGNAAGIGLWELEGAGVETVITDTFLPTTTPEGKKHKNTKTKYFLRCEI